VLDLEFHVFDERYISRMVGLERSTLRRDYKARRISGSLTGTPRRLILTLTSTESEDVVSSMTSESIELLRSAKCFLLLEMHVVSGQ
jgi:hypothetical protein